MTNRNQDVKITREIVVSILNYDPSTGIFSWKETRNGNCQAGMIAGSLHKKGYIYIQVFGRSFKAHRLAWLIVYGKLPSKQLDHINGNKADNRIENLRDATNAENQWNVGIRKDNTTGHRGITCKSGRYHARIQKDGERLFLGVFETLEDAVAARDRATKELYGQFAKIA